MRFARSVEDLSSTPEEAQQTAQDTFKALMGVGTPEEERAKSAVYLALVTAGSAIGLVTSVAEREWDKAVIAVLVLTLWAVNVYRQYVVKTSVTGRDKTSKSTESTERPE